MYYAGDLPFRRISIRRILMHDMVRVRVRARDRVRIRVRTEIRRIGIRRIGLEPYYAYECMEVKR